MNFTQTETNDVTAATTNGTTGAEVTQACETQRPLWLSAEEAEMLLSMCSLSPVSAGELEETLFCKMGKVIGSFETPHPKEL